MTANWTANTTINLGAVVKASSTLYSGVHFKCTNAGSTGATQPDWSATLGTTTTDNTVVWTAISSIYESANKLAPDPYIELFELRPIQNLHNTSTPIRWHNGANEAITGSVVFNGLTYNRIAIEASGFEETSTGTMPRPKLSISNSDLIISLLLNDINNFNYGNDLAGAEIRRIKTLKKHLDNGSDPDPSVTAPYQIWYIDRKESENSNIVVFELSTQLDQPNRQVPKRQLIGNCCQWQYKSSECSYTGTDYFDKNDNSVSAVSADVCGKRLSSCKKRFGEDNPLPFGSFPAAGRTQ